MKISIIITVFESYMIVKRQIKYFKSLNLPDNIEIIFMDDGSEPAIKSNGKPKNFNIYPTGDKRPWSQACARNLGAIIAEGEYLLMTDIDHILTREAIAAVENFNGDKMRFEREYAVLDRNGKIDQRPKSLYRYGLSKAHYRRRGTTTKRHTNSFAIKREIYSKLGGYPERYCNRPKGGNKGDRNFHNRFKKEFMAGKYEPVVRGPVILTYPGSPRDPLNVFHKLKRYPKGAPFK